VAIVVIGGGQAERDVRVLGRLDGAFDLLRASCALLIPWLDTNATAVAAALSAVAAVLTIAAGLSARRRVGPIALFALSLSLAAWGEALVLSEQTMAGIALFGLALCTAALLGFFFPLPGRAEWMTAGSTMPGSAFARWECHLVAGLTLLALITRIYGLNETPNNFENEMILGMLSSRSLFGAVEYAAFSLRSNTNGFIHLFLQLLTYEVFGTSVFSLRLTGALWSTATVPLFYWLLRRLGGVSAGVIGTLLLISAPEQLFWSRCETVCIALLTTAAVVTAALGVRVLRGAPIAALLALLLWLPFSRFFYSPVIVLPVFCVLIYAHSLLFVRGAWRTAARVVPVLGLALWLWFYSLTAAHSVFSAGAWQFIHPAQSGGALVWEGEGRDAARAPSLIAAQVANLARNLQIVGKATAHSSGGFEGWYRRQDPSRHPTWINVAIIVLGAVGVGYLLGQLRDPRAFALLLWLGLGLAPGLFSLDPVPRRMGLAFPALYAVIALALAAALDFFKTRVRRGITFAAQAAIAVGVGLIAWTSMGSHFLLPMTPTYIDQVKRVSRPVMAGSDAVLYTLAPVWGEILAFVHGERVYRDDGVTCIRKVNWRDFLSTALQQGCDYEDTPLRFTIAPETRAALRSSYRPRHVSFLVGEYGLDVGHQRLLRALFPAAPASALRVAGTGFNVLWLEVDRATAEGLRQPVLRSGGDGAALATQLLAGVTLAPVPVADGPGASVDGGMLISENGWYTVALEPACAGASLSIDGEERAGASPFALTAGVHRFGLSLPNPSACALPLGLRTQRFERGVMLTVSAPALVAPAAVDVEPARARELVSYAGFREVTVPLAGPGVVLDLGADASGELFLLSDDNAERTIRRVGADGAQAATWRVHGEPPVGMSVAPDGTVFVVYADRVALYSRAGQPIGVWQDSPMRTAAVGHLATGEVLVPLINNGAVVVLDRKGKIVRTWTEFQGGPGKFSEPTSAGVSAGGDVLVIELDGTASVFHTPVDRFEPTFVRSFRVEFPGESVVSGGWAFAGEKRVIIPDPTAANTFIYRLDGARVMARSPQLDFSQVVGDLVRRVVVAGEGVYTLDGARRLRKFVHVTDAAPS
jgi:hypothetical protein